MQCQQNYSSTCTTQRMSRQSVAMVVFCDLRENDALYSFENALRPHKVDDCGHFAPHIEVSTTTRM